MNNNERKLSLEAYNHGYASAMIDMTDDYDYASEATNLRRGAAHILGGNLVAAIYNAVHTSNIKKSAVASVSDMTRIGIPQDKAKKQVASTIKFFKSKGYLAKDFDGSADTVAFNDLTPEGQEYIKGFYTKMNNIEQFTVEKAVNARKPDSWNAANVGFVISVINLICTLVLVPFSFGGSLVGTAISAAFMSYYKKEQDRVEKFESTEVKESVNIFDPSFFEE